MFSIWTLFSGKHAVEIFPSLRLAVFIFFMLHFEKKLTLFFECHFFKCVTSIISLNLKNFTSWSSHFTDEKLKTKGGEIIYTLTQGRGSQSWIRYPPDFGA